MKSRRRLLSLMFLCAFVIFGHATMELSPVMCETPENAEIEICQTLKPDEFITNWLILGAIPVSNEGENPDEEAQKAAFDENFLADQGGEAGIQPKPGLTHKIGDAEYSWQAYHSESDIIDLSDSCSDKEFAVAYAWAEIDSPEATEAILGIGSDDAVKLWLNGELVHENWIGRPTSKDNDIVGVDLREEKNTVLLKILNMESDWGFACRVISPESLIDTIRLKVAEGDLDTIKMLISHGVDANAKDEIGLTALHAAKIHGRAEIVEFLLENGADPDIEMPSPETLMDAIFKDAAQGDSPGIAVLVAKDGKILYEKGFGYANVEDSVPITPETKFRIGSVTKQFTAAAILKLQEDGLLSVDDKLSKFIPDYPRGDEVTIHHLLTHTSGIHSFTSKPDFYDTVTEAIEPEAHIESFKNDKYDFDPGEKWSYNNSGYFLLGYLVENISEKSFDDYLKEQFFDPLGMKDTGIHRHDLELENEALGYSYQAGGFQRALDWDMSRAGGAGALYSTVGDLYRWNEGIFGGKVLGESTLKTAFTPVTLNSGEVANAMGAKYGYGWLMLETRGLQEIQHGGGLNGFNSQLVRYPEQNTTIAVLANCVPPPPPEAGSVGLISSAGAQAAAYFYLWEQMDAVGSFTEDLAVDKSVYDDYVGKYDYGSVILEVTREGDRLFAQMTGQPKYEIFPMSEAKFAWKVVDAQVTFARNEAGEVTHVIHNQSGGEIKASKMQDMEIDEVDPDVYEAYVGDYDYGGGAILTVTIEGDQLFAQMTAQPKFEIFPVSETKFTWNVVNAQIKFIKDDNDKVVKAIHYQGGMEIEATKIK